MQLLLKGMCVRVPAAHCSKANTQARLGERKVWFISGAGNCGRRMAGICSKADSPSLTVSREEFYRLREGATCGNSTVSSDSHLQIGH